MTLAVTTMKCGLMVLLKIMNYVSDLPVMCGNIKNDNVLLFCFIQDTIWNVEMLNLTV